MNMNYLNNLTSAVDAVRGTQSEYCKTKVDGQEVKLYQRADRVDYRISKTQRKKVDRQLAELSTGELVIVDIFNDGTWLPGAYITGVQGPWKAYNVEVEQKDLENVLFSLHFEGSNDWIVGEVKKLSGKYLHDLLVQMGVHIKTAFSKNSIREALYEGFAGAIHLTQSTVSISALAGWHNGKFQCAESYVFAKSPWAKDFPVMQKHFAMLEMEEKTAERYFCELNQISDEKDRLLISVFPFAAFISSLLRKDGLALNFGLNFVIVSGFDKSKICSWLQTFNRKILLPLDADVTDKEMKEILRGINDEVLMLDGTFNEDEDDYRKKKKKRSLLQAIRVINGEERVSGRISEAVCAGIATFSNDIVEDEHMFNIFITEDFHGGRECGFITEKVMEKILTSFIKFVRKEMGNSLHDIIIQPRQFADSRCKILKISFDIVQKFWEERGIDFMGSIGAENVSFEAFFDGSMYDGDDMIEEFAIGFRREVRNYFFTDGDMNDRPEGKCIHYDEAYLDIPTGIFRKILGAIGLKSYERPLLVELKRRSFLSAYGEGYTSKKMTAGERRTVYKIKRDLFNRDGLADIVALGGERDDC